MNKLKKQGSRIIHTLNRERIETFIVLLLTPFSAFYLLQFVYSATVYTPSFKIVVGNALCIGAVYYLLCAISTKVALSSLFVHGAALLLGAVNAFLVQFRGNPLLPWDLMALDTALAVSSSYSYQLTTAALIGLMWIMLLLLFFIMMHKRNAFVLRFKVQRSFLGLWALVCMYPLVHPETLKRFDISSDVWNQAQSYQEKGIIGAFLSNLIYLNVEIPQGYNKETWEHMLNRWEMKEIAHNLSNNEAVGLPHVVVIMNESWADYEEFGHLSLNQSVMKEIYELDNAKVGHAYTSVFGAGTSASEFEFLTGHSMAFLPSGSIPYQQYILTPTDSLASLLKSKGYHTLAIHPGQRSSWQRDMAYPLLGFDDFIDQEQMTVPLTYQHSGYISDESSFQQIIAQFEKKETQERLFVFNVTIQNHGSYTDPDYPTEIILLDEPDAYPMAEQYLTLVNKTEEAFIALIEYFKAYNEPVIVLMFGDHQPALEQDFLTKALGYAQDDMTMEQYLSRFRVPFVIWSNHSSPEIDTETTSLNFLKEILLEAAGIETTAYGNFLNAFRQTLPALTFAGYFDQSQKAISHLEVNEYEEFIAQYQYLQYGILFD